MILDAVRQELDTSKDERGSRCVFRLDVETNFSPRGAGGGSIKRRIAETKVCIASSWPPTRALQFGQLSGQFLVSGEQFPQFHESPYHVYTYLNRAGRIENARCHYRTMLGKRIGQRARELQPREVVTVCDHLFFLGRRQFKAKIARKPLSVAADRLVEGLRCRSIKLGQIGVQHHPLSTDHEDTWLNLVN